MTIFKRTDDNIGALSLAAENVAFNVLQLWLFTARLMVLQGILVKIIPSLLVKTCHFCQRTNGLVFSNTSGIQIQRNASRILRIWNRNVSYETTLRIDLIRFECQSGIFLKKKKKKRNARTLMVFVYQSILFSWFFKCLTEEINEFWRQSWYLVWGFGRLG